MPGRMIKILIIDDNKDLCRLIKYFFHSLGNYKVLIAEGGDIGSWLASCRWHKPDIILLDIRMPRIDGFEVLRRLRKGKNTMLTPVIMLTALGDPASRVKAEGLYCDDYIVKPADPATLKSKVESVLAQRGIIPRK